MCSWSNALMRFSDLLFILFFKSTFSFSFHWDDLSIRVRQDDVVILCIKIPEKIYWFKFSLGIVSPAESSLLRWLFFWHECLSFIFIDDRDPIYTVDIFDWTFGPAASWSFTIFSSYRNRISSLSLLSCSRSSRLESRTFQSQLAILMNLLLVAWWRSGKVLFVMILSSTNLDDLSPLSYRCPRGSLCLDESNHDEYYGTRRVALQ